MKKRIVTVSALCVMLSLLLLTGKKSSATEYIYNNTIYNVAKDSPRGMDLANSAANTNLKVSAYARPDMSNQQNDMGIYEDSHYKIVVAGPITFVGANPGTRIRFTLPVNKTYHALITTNSISRITGLFTAYY